MCYTLMNVICTTFMGILPVTMPSSQIQGSILDANQEYSYYGDILKLTLICSIANQV